MVSSTSHLIVVVFSRFWATRGQPALIVCCGLSTKSSSGRILERNQTSRLQGRLCALSALYSIASTFRRLRYSRMSCFSNRTAPPTLMNGRQRALCRSRTFDSDMRKNLATSLTVRSSSSPVGPIGEIVGHSSWRARRDNVLGTHKL